MILFANELLRRDYRVNILVLSAEGPLKQMVAKEIEIISLQTKRAFKSLPKVIKYLNINKPTALYSTIIHINLISVLAKFLSRSSTKVIIRESNTPKSAFSHSRSGRISLRLLPYLYPLAHTVIAVSNGVKDALIEMSSKLDEKTKIVPTPVISDEIFQLAEAKLEPKSSISNFDANKPYLLGAGRLHFQKDFQTLIEAFSIISKENNDLSLLILGEGEERKALEQLISDLNLSDRVHLPGFVENPFYYFARASTFVLSSKFEGMPNVLIQALAFGTPSVATNCKSGPIEISEDGRYCKIVPVSDSKAMADAIRESIKSEPNREAANAMINRFGIKNAVDEYLAII